MLYDLKNKRYIKERPDLASAISGRLGRHLFRCRDVLPFESENLWLYESAFPRLMALYWYGCAAKSKFKKLFKKK